MQGLRRILRTIAVLALLQSSPAYPQWGAVDTNFDAQIQPVPGYVYALLALPNVQLLVGGQIALASGLRSQGMALLQTNGTPAAGFNSPFGVGTDVRCLARQIDGKFLVGGNLLGADGKRVGAFCRLHPDGSIDSSFQVTLPPEAFGLSVAAQPDGRILASSLGRLFRLEVNGAVDSSFKISTNFDGRVQGFLLLSSGQILLRAYSPSGTSIGVHRLLGDGAEDPSFAAQDMGFALAIAARPDGKILVGGSADPTTGALSNALTLLLTDGNTDTNFHGPLGSNSAVNAILPALDGTAIVGGHLIAANGDELEANGTIDTTFSFPSETSGTVFAAQILASGDVVIGGQFGLAGGIERFGLAKLTSSSQPRLLAGTETGTITLQGNTGRSYRIDASDNLSDWTPLTTVLNTNGIVPFVDSEMATRTNRFYRAVLVWP